MDEILYEGAIYTHVVSKYIKRIHENFTLLSHEIEEIFLEKPLMHGLQTPKFKFKFKSQSQIITWDVDIVNGYLFRNNGENRWGTQNGCW